MYIYTYIYAYTYFKKKLKYMREKNLSHILNVLLVDSVEERN